MLRNPFFIFLFLLVNQSIFAQNQFISTSISFNRMDYFHSLNLSKKIQKWEIGAGAGYGINRTIFQQRFFPRLQINTGYCVLQKKKWSIEPTVSICFSWLKVNKSSKYFTNWTETLGGFTWFYGEKWAIGQTLQLGYQFENYHNSITNQRQFVGVWAYSFDLKLRYAL